MKVSKFAAIALLAILASNKGEETSFAMSDLTQHFGRPTKKDGSGRKLPKGFGRKLVKNLQKLKPGTSVDLHLNEGEVVGFTLNAKDHIRYTEFTNSDAQTFLYSKELTKAEREQTVARLKDIAGIASKPKKEKGKKGKKGKKSVQLATAA